MSKKKKSGRRASGNPANNPRTSIGVTVRRLSNPSDIDALLGALDSDGPLPAARAQVSACDVCGADVQWMSHDDAMHYAAHDPATATLFLSDRNMLADVWTCSRRAAGCEGGATLLHRFVGI